ncbi:sulfurtransferase TusA family protein [Catenovulum sp. SX2]|uniref:sulfurtransferase TusA family protein n=1 Tax=Catenovulum TaxID=1172191 RepID=UPI00030D138D|nr:sulfurtransferase TusA family protein [Catenovulum agarivorans]
MKVDLYIDATGLVCPLPVLKFKRECKQLSKGQVVHVRTTDPDSVNDFNAYSELKGMQILQNEKNEQGFEFLIQL